MEVSDKLKRFLQNSGCPGLPGGGSALVATRSDANLLLMPPPCAVEVHGWCSLLKQLAAPFSNKREPPPDKPVASQEFWSSSIVAASVSLPRASRGHPSFARALIC